ncbi:hypothetical protein F4782DRAFT_529581 [Xylaria castorea]|nr:hypothetical protein F4782DRAFT_529581 [Xylaria castorea]
MTAVENVNYVDAVYDAHPDEPPDTSYEDQSLKGFFIVACLGGRFPYIIKETNQRCSAEPTLRCFEYCGECYLYGAMNGEDFKVRDERGRRVLTSNADSLAEIALV